MRSTNRISNENLGYASYDVPRGRGDTFNVS